MAETSSDFQKRMREIITWLEKWNYEYYTLNEPTLADEVYDQYLHELKQLEKEYNFVFPDSPTQKIGHGEGKKLRLVQRQNPMLSLDSVDNIEDLLRFDERVKKILKTTEDITFVSE
jgi:DNA ligase (NAD+)